MLKKNHERSTRVEVVVGYPSSLATSNCGMDIDRELDSIVEGEFKGQELFGESLNGYRYKAYSVLESNYTKCIQSFRKFCIKQRFAYWRISINS